MHDLHESVPFLYTFSGQAPQNPLLDPIVYGELPWFANFEMAQLTSYGMPGVWTHGFVDMWSPGYLAFMASNHNGLIRFYETFGNGGATTMTRRLKTDDNTAEQARTSREWYRPSPPYEEVEWSMRNNTNYSQTAALTALQLASSNPEVILGNFYRKSRNALLDGERNPPHGFVIPGDQRDMTRAATLVDLLRIQGIEVGRSGEALAFGDDTWPAGSYVIKGGQPYFRLAKILLGNQEFPDDGLRTYDDTGWTMGPMHRTEVVAIEDPAVLDAPVEPIEEARIRGTVAGNDRARFGYAVAHYGSNHLTTLRYRLGNAPVEAAEEGFEADGLEFPPGSFIVPAAAGSDRAERLRRSNRRPAGHRRRAARRRARRPVRHQPVLPVAEPRRVRDAVQHDPALRRPGQPARRHPGRRSRALKPVYRGPASSSRVFARAISRSASAMAPSSQTSHS